MKIFIVSVDTDGCMHSNYWAEKAFDNLKAAEEFAESLIRDGKAYGTRVSPVELVTSKQEESK